ncbi:MULTISPECIES: hypothetical protein [Bradyrhizobium]|jgi:hypothetical protein|uniref:hypothetical protein n=1 Tax=Bradyrhizobium TaxID=374 RepID=UPI0009455E23|nr:MULTISPECIES: hypothetical protein [Bradyrhizobium]
MKRDLLLVLGILLSTASQLRPAGEICLVLWIGLMLGREAARLGPQFTPALSRLVSDSRHGSKRSIAGLNRDCSGSGRVHTFRYHPQFSQDDRIPRESQRTWSIPK